MTKYYFKSIEQQGDIYFQLRYHTAYQSDKCYEAIIILVSPTGQIKQFVDNYNEDNFKFIQKNFQPSNSTEFNSIQETKILGGAGKRQEVYSIYYNQWKEYFLAKKKSLEAVRSSSTTNNWNYYDRLESEWKKNGIYIKRKFLQKFEYNVRQQNNISLSDIYREARHQATLDYTANRI